MTLNVIRPLAVVAVLSLSAGSIAQTTQRGAEHVGETVYPATVTVNLKNAPKPNNWKPGDAVKEIPLRFHRPKNWQRPEAAERGYGFDPLATKQLNVQPATEMGGAMFDSTVVNVDGLGFTGVNPSDTNGDVGIDHYIQSINNGSSSGVLILNKSDGTVAAQFVMDAIASGSGTGCGAGTGDPIILFDQFVDNGPGNPKGRWVLTEFTDTSLCLYISKTHSPIGPQDDSTWHIYEFDSATGGLPDYPKFGVWRDGYYVGANEGNRLYAFDRENMLNGAPARGYQVFTAPGLPGFGFQHMMPADADGETLPPAGAPAIFMRHRDSEYHGDANPEDVLEIWEFTTDFDTPANSSLTGPTNVVVSEFDTHLGGSNFGDLSVPQPSGTNLFPLKQPLMWRVQHRTLDDKQYLVGNMVTDVDGNDYHGVRWWQLERPAATVAGGWTLKDEGTYTNNDGVHRWMASAAMDGSGNIAIGYNTSGTSTFAGMRYAGRLASDPAGTMPRGENSIIEGSGANGSSRYGDYSSISVDPVDDCTFWYTAQYNPSSQWGTRVGAFRFEACGCQLSLTPITLQPATTPSDNTVEITWDDAVDAEISEYRVYRSTTSGTDYELIATVNDSSPGVGSNGQYSYQDTTVSGGTEYHYVIRTSDGAACQANNSNEVSVTATGVCTLGPQFAGVESVTNQATASCALSVSWNAASSMCPNGNGQISYDVFRSETPGFTPDLSNRVATGVSGLSVIDQDNVQSDVDYHYIVRAVDADNQLDDGNLNEVTGFATGVFTSVPFVDDLESYVDMTAAENAGWSHTADVGNDDWRLETGNDNTSGSGNAFVSTDVDVASDKSLITRSFSPGNNAVLSFYHSYEFELDSVAWDGGVIEISLDGGSSWIDLGPQITEGEYNAVLNGSGGANPLGAVPAWSGTQASFGLVEVDLSPYAGAIALIRWRMGTDAFVGGGDWLIDDITISNAGEYGVCTVFDSDLIFEDGFE